MGLSLWETIKHYIQGTDLVEKPKDQSIGEILFSTFYSLFWILVIFIGFPAYLYYLYQDVNVERFFKAMFAILCLIVLYRVIAFLVSSYSGTKIVALRYTLGGLIGFSSLLYGGLLLFLARRGRHHNEVVEGGRRRRH